jgi:hypothetical protein
VPKILYTDEEHLLIEEFLSKHDPERHPILGLALNEVGPDHQTECLNYMRLLGS